MDTTLCEDLRGIEFLPINMRFLDERLQTPLLPMCSGEFEVRLGVIANEKAMPAGADSLTNRHLAHTFGRQLRANFDVQKFLNHVDVGARVS